jgi:Uma2 family endonuclease
MIAQKPLIVEAFESLISQPENTKRKLELINGKMVEEMPNRLHSLIAALLTAIFVVYFEKNPIGWAFTEARVKFPNDPLNDMIPDVCVALAENHTILTDDLTEPFTTMPELVIEIQSPGQTEDFMIEKADLYLQHEARISIIVYPLERKLEVRRPGAVAQFSEGDSVDLNDLLPGLSFRVSKIFPKVE